MATGHKAILAVLSLGIALTLPALAQDIQANGDGAGNSVAAARDITTARIFYSGHMFGYLRRDKNKENHPGTLFSPAGQFLQKYLEECPPTRCVLLGMGDNFSPKYEARLADNGNFKKRDGSNADYHSDNVAAFLHEANFNALVPGKEDFYLGAYRLWKIARSFSTENNKYGGPFLADNLVLRPSDEKDRELKPESKKSFTDNVDGIKPKFSGNAMPWLVKLSFVLDPKRIAVDPTRFGGYLCPAGRDRDDIPVDDFAKKCESWHPGEEPGVFIRTQNTQNPTSPRQSVPDNEQNPYNKPVEKTDLMPGADYGFCLTGITFRGPKTTYCLPIHVEVPMFPAPYVLAHDPLNNNAEVAIFAVVDSDIRSYLPKQNAGWDVSDSDGNVLKKSVDQKNGFWLPHHVEIATLPPQDALQQALDAFLLDHGSFSGATVLMAQTDMEHADEMARHLSAPALLKLNRPTRGGPKNTPDEPAFDLIVARADSTHQSRPQTSHLLPPVTNARPRFLAVPPPAYNDETQEIQLPLGWVTLSRGQGAASATYEVRTNYCGLKDVQGKPLPLEGCSAGSTSAAWNELESRLFLRGKSGPYAQCYQAIGNLAPDDCDGKDIKACLMKFATCAMLQGSKTFHTEGSDAAFLQDRDIWFPDNHKDPPYDKDKERDQSTRAWRIHLADVTLGATVQSILDRIFWKDDLLAHVNLSGSQLKSLVKKSEDNGKEEKNPLWILRDATGRELEFSGMLKGTNPKPGSKDPAFYAHLDEMSDSALYRVAASSYVSNGDTGYAEFSTPAEGKVEFFRAERKGVRISVLVCEALQEGVVKPSDLYQCGDPGMVPQKDYVMQKDYAVTADETKKIAGLLVHDDREQDGPVEYLEVQFHELGVGRDPFSARSPAAGTPESKSEKQLQNYPYLDVNLEQLAIAGTLNTALASIAETANFSGVLQSDIPQPTKSEFSWNTKLRVLERRGRWDFGGAINEQFDKSVVGSLTEPSTPAWSSNSLAVGPVVQFSMSDPRSAPRHLLTFHLSDYTRQITNTSLSLSGANNIATGLPSASFALSQRASYGLQPKGGYRYESGDSYLEFGGLYARNYDVLSEVAGLPGGVVCDISGNISLSECVGNITFPPGSPTPILHYSNFSQAGIYWDGKLSIDVFKGKWSYVFTSSGNYYPVSDSESALTRLDARLGNSLKFPLFGNFSLVPAAEWRFFENQGTRDYLKRINTSVALTYSFHKDSRVRLKDVMLYKPSTVPAP